MKNIDRFLELTMTAYRGMRLTILEIEQHPGYLTPGRFYIVAIVAPTREELDVSTLLNISKTWYPVVASPNIGDAMLGIEAKLNKLNYGHWPRTMALIFDAFYVANGDSVAWLDYHPNIEEAMYSADLSRFFHDHIVSQKAAKADQQQV